MGFVRCRASTRSTDTGSRKTTNPNPRDFLVSRLKIICAVSTSPNSSNKLRSTSGAVAYLRPPTKILFGIISELLGGGETDSRESPVVVVEVAVVFGENMRGEDLAEVGVGVARAVMFTGSFTLTAGTGSCIADRSSPPFEESVRFRGTASLLSTFLPSTMW